MSNDDRLQASRSDPSTWRPDARIGRSARAVAAEVDGEVLVMNIDRETFFALDEIGGKIWRLLEAPISFGHLIQSLSLDYEADPSTIASEVAAFLDRLMESDIATRE